MLSLIDQCRAAKEEKHITNKDIADGSGVPLNTVNNMFRATTHSPTLETLGPICAYLGISIDQFLGMEPTEDSPPPETIEEIVNREMDVYRQEINGLNAQNELLREFMERQSHGIRNRDRLLRWLLVLLICTLAYAVYLDLHCLEFGFFHG